MSEKEDRAAAARSRLLDALPMLSVAFNEAKIEAPQGKAILAFGYKLDDGSGRITASFEYEPFVDDVMALLGFASMHEVLMAAVASLDLNHSTDTRTGEPCDGLTAGSSPPGSSASSRAST